METALKQNRAFKINERFNESKEIQFLNIYQIPIDKKVIPHIPTSILIQLQIEDDFPIEKINEIVKEIRKQKNKKEMTNLYSAHQVNVNGFDYVEFRFELGYMRLLSDYHKNNLQFEEISSQLNDIIKCYIMCVEMKLPVHISMDDMSFMMKKNKASPFPQISITPFAFIQGYIDRLDEEEQNIHVEFGEIIDLLSDKYVKFTKRGKPFEEIIKRMKNGEDCSKEFEKDIYFEQIQSILNVPIFKLEDYKVIRKLGGGQFGTVVEVEHLETGKHYALKESTKLQMDSLHREAYVLNSMNHETIVKCHGFICEEKCMHQSINDQCFPHAFLLMDLCKCGNLESYLNLYFGNKNPVTRDFVKTIFGQIAEACLYVHFERRYIHRDLKLSNIVIEKRFPYLQIKLCDFGFARTLDTRMVSCIGTPICVYPKILENEEYDDRSDLFSIGCMLYFILHGKYPGAARRRGGSQRAWFNGTFLFAGVEGLWSPCGRVRFAEGQRTAGDCAGNGRR